MQAVPVVDNTWAQYVGEVRPYQIDFSIWFDRNSYDCSGITAEIETGSDLATVSNQSTFTGREELVPNTLWQGLISGTSTGIVIIKATAANATNPSIPRIERIRIDLIDPESAILGRTSAAGFSVYTG